MGGDKQKPARLHDLVDFKDSLPRHCQVFEGGDCRDRVKTQLEGTESGRQFVDVTGHIDVRPWMNVDANVSFTPNEETADRRPPGSEFENRALFDFFDLFNEVTKIGVEGVEAVSTLRGLLAISITFRSNRRNHGGGGLSEVLTTQLR